MDMPDFTREEVIAKVAAEESLEGANLRGANLTWTDLRAANLVDANLSGANLSRADLSGARYDATWWPEGFDPEAAGAVLVDD